MSKKGSNPPPPPGVKKPPPPPGPPPLPGGFRTFDNKINTAIDPISGLTKAEKRCHDHLMAAFKEWMALEKQHPDDDQAISDAVHVFQQLLVFRIARRKYPKYWVNYARRKK